MYKLDFPYIYNIYDFILYSKPSKLSSPSNFSDKSFEVKKFLLEKVIQIVSKTKTRSFFDFPELKVIQCK